MGSPHVWEGSPIYLLRKRREVDMPGGRAAKSRGTSFEYRVREYLRNLGWTSERNPLSGASQQIVATTGKHDVRASKEGIFLQLECKKTGHQTKHVLRREWIEKIDFTNDEYLVFAFGRSDAYVLILSSVYQTLDPNYKLEVPRYEAIGGTRFTFHRSWMEEEDPLTFMWKDYNEMFVVTPLARFIELVSARGPLKAIKPLDFINSATEILPLATWYKENKFRLTNFERCHFYGKMHRLEHGISDEVSPEFKASVQWWRDTSDDVVMKCPHCDNLITYKQWQEKRRNKEIVDRN